jgi:hypothetical protein
MRNELIALHTHTHTPFTRADLLSNLVRMVLSKLLPPRPGISMAVSCTHAREVVERERERERELR